MNSTRDEEIELLESVAEAADRFATFVIVRKGRIDVGTAERFLTVLKVAQNELAAYRVRRAPSDLDAAEQVH